jgi:hypothetical protein
VLINIVTRCASSGATKSADSSVNSVDLQRTLSHRKPEPLARLSAVVPHVVV